MAVLHTFIFKGGMKTKRLTGMSAIREKCLECQCWSYTEVADCALWPFRFGKYPKNATTAENNELATKLDVEKE